MKHQWNLAKQWILIILIGAILTGCGIFSSPSTEDVGSPTPTPTEQGMMIVTEESHDNPCQGLTGDIEVQILVGPAEAVGLEPVTVGEIPFTVVSAGDSFLVEGGGQLESYTDLLTAEWGTYTVTFEGDTTVSGECVSTGENAELNLSVEMSGEQNVEIVYDGQTMNFPWSGTTQIDATLPVQEGAQSGGEGWNLILHLNQQ